MWGPMGNCGWGWGGMMGVGMLLFWGLLIVVIVMEWTPTSPNGIKVPKWWLQAIT